jgi:GDP-4-dehydro-6-deoxy-D-mannose reductase
MTYVKHCLVTGAAGQVGQHLVRLLARRGHTVTTFDRSPLVSGSNIQAMTGELDDPAALAGALKGHVDIVFHLAGLNALETAAAIHRVNVEGTATLLAALERRRSPCCIVLMSSSAVYGSSQDDPILETSDLAPQTPYAHSKAAAEATALRYHAAGLDIRIARPFNIIGPGQRAPLLYNKVAAQLVEIARGTRAAKLELGNLQSFRDVIDVRDVCEGLAAIAESGQAGEAYNLSSGTATAMREIVDQLVALSGLAVRVTTTPPAGTDVPYQRGSHEKLSKASGWMPDVSLQTSLRDTLEWWRQLAGNGNNAKEKLE